MKLATSSKQKLMSKKGTKFRVGLVHFQAIALAIVYYLISGLLFVRFVTLKSIFLAFLGPVIFGTAASIAFLYLFNNKNFFPFASAFEKEQMEKEKGYLVKFKHWGKILACIVISEIAGPVFLALTVRFLFPKKANRYLITIVSTIISTVFAVALAKGLLSFL